MHLRTAASRTGRRRVRISRGGFSVAEVAEMFGASEITVRRAIKAGELRAFRLRGRVVVPVEAVEALKNAHTTGSRGPEGGAA
ncbi:helix-turn-helix domain-containing protein [Actinopolymorpha sp. B9G3]|uniref:helix-turn-helix domain-containing protein n=1 Tax=Actinopolymorpha sp. B9G3 TaxID=3158970 RepID=UPI0032D8DB5B